MRILKRSLHYFFAPYYSVFMVISKVLWLAWFCFASGQSGWESKWKAFQVAEEAPGSVNDVLVGYFPWILWTSVAFHSVRNEVIYSELTFGLSLPYYLFSNWGSNFKWKLSMLVAACYYSFLLLLHPILEAFGNRLHAVWNLELHCGLTTCDRGLGFIS